MDEGEDGGFGKGAFSRGRCEDLVSAGEIKENVSFVGCIFRGKEFDVIAVCVSLAVVA